MRGDALGQLGDFNYITGAQLELEYAFGFEIIVMLTTATNYYHIWLIVKVVTAELAHWASIEYQFINLNQFVTLI